MRAFVLLLFALLSGGEDLAALVAAAGKHVAAVAGFHALTETVNLFALPFLRLECTKHFFCTSFPNVLYQAVAARRGRLCPNGHSAAVKQYNPSVYDYIRKASPLSRKYA